jgi:hypothetical protein
MMLVRGNKSTCPGACRLHMALPVVEVLKIDKLQFVYLFVYCLSVFLYSTVTETCSWLLIHVKAYCAIRSFSKCKCQVSVSEGCDGHLNTLRV